MPTHLEHYQQKPCWKIRQNAIARDELSDARSQAEYWLETGYGLDDDVHLYPSLATNELSEEVARL
ncbi:MULTISPECIES: hypothetical protein [Leptolyngbya]|jgi:hypothetical protein|nr:MULTISPECIES: hypothetical protein [Leptolyngbya]MBD2370995.1 hypothetical protein [Leptolyngbya sp. FACHB-161]MBD2377509.1 hypothetical protein [Leptolyngbya sp. FACHB-238]MBD2401918.1 hypothetical protein [Leptolyngbya sp. FACHB-239]MBD2408435.1 hypothetical protein [Leptolyngbya sp. FACHB-402]ULP29596.1 hypothetical protein MCP04_26795 [Leptolyngbya boryana IU 594]